MSLLSHTLSPQLPQLFHQSVPNLRNADLLFVIGTSLTVQPFASLASLVPEHCPRVLINLDLVGDFGSRPDDVVCLGKCDDIVRDLCKELGWADELEAAWKETEHSLVDFGEGGGTPERGPQLTEEAEERQLEEDVEEITEKLREVLGNAPDADAAASDKRNDTHSPKVSDKEVSLIGPDESQDVREAPATDQDEEKAKEKL